MEKMRWTAPFESSLSVRAQFQALTLFAWISAVMFAVHCWRYARPLQLGERITLPFVHLLPWFVALIERKAWTKANELGDAQDDRGIRVQTSLIRVLWATYAALVVIEIW